MPDRAICVYFLLGYWCECTYVLIASWVTGVTVTDLYVDSASWVTGVNVTDLWVDSVSWVTGVNVTELYFDMSVG